MTARLLGIIAACVVGVAFLCVAGIAGIGGAASWCALLPAVPGSTSRYDADQLHNASIIVDVGVRRGIPIRAAVIAVATAIQESNLRNLGDLGPDNDHDSLGLFQQRPSQGWGTPEQIMNPEYASGRFYDALLAVAGWQTLPLTRAAQAVQRSAYPDAYAKHEPDATAVVAAVSGLTAGDIASGRAQDCADVAGWMKPVHGPIVSPFGMRDGALHAGVDIAAAKGTPIHAAASGIVITVRCNAHLATGGSYSCDVDGDPVAVRGCGWYVELQHADQAVTRYCHMVSRPVVDVGQRVAVGQVIGLVGSSGHSSGPHLHLEAHLGAPATNDNAVDPVPFFQARLVDLTKS
ncbi:M23 family metallopeptidase [Dactylosporangium salmoneum]|uniref:M23ase beta-sheet core domain-containing protein n=1 Tax=Dactylosporangium salmoneum TaxID=53361 RepID=A0ABP5TCK9_9ACTN